MKLYSFFLLVLIVSILWACNDEYPQPGLSVSDNFSFTGTFKAKGSENVLGSIVLSVADGHYRCITNLPFGHGAGRLVVDGSRINFIDTLFVAVPAMYGSSYVLSGEYKYTFNGERLKIWQKENSGAIEYMLRPVAAN